MLFAPTAARIRCWVKLVCAQHENEATWIDNRRNLHFDLFEVIEMDI